jgi:hypothetical protein
MIRTLLLFAAVLILAGITLARIAHAYESRPRPIYIPGPAEYTLRRWSLEFERATGTYIYHDECPKP